MLDMFKRSSMTRGSDAGLWALSALLVAVNCYRAAPAQSEVAFERDRKAAADVLRKLLAQAKTPEDRAKLEKQLAWVESDGPRREYEETRKAIRESHRMALSQASSADERAVLERRLARIERGEPVLDRKESLAMAGYKVTKPRSQPSVYQNATHGFQVTVPAGIELQEHRNGHHVILEPHGNLFGIWIHGEASPAEVEAKLLADFERWCGNRAESAREREQNGRSLRLVPVKQGSFRGYKAVAKDLPDTAPSRFYAFKSPRVDGYFGFDLPPTMAGALLQSLQPLATAPKTK